MASPSAAPKKRRRRSKRASPKSGAPSGDGTETGGSGSQSSTHGGCCAGAAHNVAAIAAAVFELIKPEIIQLAAGRTTAPAPDEAEGLLEDIGTVVKEQLDASAGRQASDGRLETMAATIVTDVRTTVSAALKDFRDNTPVSQMSENQLRRKLNKAIPTKKIRDLHGEVLNRCLLAIINEKEESNPLTINIPALSRQLKTYANDEFSKVSIAILHRIYIANSKLIESKQPFVLRGKNKIVLDALDTVDEVAEKVVRNAFHDGRCKTRKLFYMLFAYYLMRLGASMKLANDNATEPAAGMEEGSPFFAIKLTRQASCSGMLPEHGSPAPESNLDAPADSPLSGVHEVLSDACLYDIALKLLAAIVRSPFTFDGAVVTGVARTLRRILVSPDRRWLRMCLKDAEETKESGAWALLLPRKDGRKDMDVIVQQLSSSESHAITRKAAREGPSAGATTPGDAGSPPPRQATPDLL